MGRKRSGRVEKSKKCGASVVSPPASTGASAALRPFLGPLSRFRLWGGRGWVDEPEKEGEEAASAINVRRRAARRRGTLRRARVCERAGWGGVEGDEGGDGGVLGPWAHRSLAAAHLRSTVEPPLTPRVHARRLHRRRGRRRRRNDDGQ
ncbi:unnamed protein product, partial [Ixodes persulcatus]